MWGAESVTISFLKSLCSKLNLRRRIKSVFTEEHCPKFPGTQHCILLKIRNTVILPGHTTLYSLKNSKHCQHSREHNTVFSWKFKTLSTIPGTKHCILLKIYNTVTVLLLFKQNTVLSTVLGAQYSTVLIDVWQFFFRNCSTYMYCTVFL